MESKSAGADKVTIKIPRPLYEKIKSVIADAGYDSVTDFVVYVLRDIVTTHNISDERHPYDEMELQKVKERLKSLGYL